MPIVMKSGSLNLLEPLGPVQACNGIALPLLIFAAAAEPDSLHEMDKRSAVHP